MSLFDTNEEIQDKINNKYEKIRLLGTGAHGKAYLCQSAGTNQKCVIKQISLSQLNESDLQKQYKEVSILRSLSHPHIIKYQDSFLFKKNYLCIVMDYAEGGDLEQRITLAQKNNTLFDNKTILKWFTQLCSAVRFIHNQKIIHRDIKNNNIFLDSKDNIVLGDFGISKKLTNLKDKANTFIGTPYFMAPEQCNQQPYTNKVDIWALGIVLYRLVYLKYPFEGFEFIHLMLAISRGVLNFPQGSQSPFKNIITKLLQNDPNKRPSIDQIFEFDEIRSYLDKTRLEKQNKNQCRLNSGRLTRIIKDNNSGQLELENNRPSSPYQKNVQKHEQKLFEFALQNYNNVRKIIQPPLSRNQSRDLSPGIQKNLNTPKLPCLKQNALPNLNSQQKVFANFKSSPNIQKIGKGLKLNIENDKNILNNLQQSPKRLNKQYSDCSTSESNKEVTPKIFLFNNNNNKPEEESPVIGMKKVIRNNLNSKYSNDGQVSSSSNNNPFSSQSTQARLKFSAKKYNNVLRRSDQIGIIPPFSPAAVPIQDITTPQSAPALQAIPSQQQFTPVMLNYKNSRSDKLSRPSLHLQQQHSDNILNQKQPNRESLQSQQYLDALKKQMKKPSKDFQFNQQPASLIPQVFKQQQQPQKHQEPESFQQALQDYTEEQGFDQHHLDDNMVCSLNTVISQDFLKNSSNLIENSNQKINNNSISNNNSNFNNGSNLFNNNMSCSINNNISNSNYNNYSNNLCSNNSNLFLNNNSNCLINNPIHKSINQQEESQGILDNSFNDRCQSFEEEEQNDNTHNQDHYFNNVDLIVSYNYSKSTLSDINSIIQSNQPKEDEQLMNPDQVIENRKNELIELLGEELYLKVSHYAARLIQHYDINKIINENLMKKQFITMYTSELKRQVNFNVDSVIFNLLKIINYEENYQLIN